MLLHKVKAAIAKIIGKRKMAMRRAQSGYSPMTIVLSIMVIVKVVIIDASARTFNVDDSARP